MDSIALFTDVSLNPGRRLGVGACLAVPFASLQTQPGGIKRADIAKRLEKRRFEDTSSTKLELQTALWALANCGKKIKICKPRKLHLFTDSSCVAGLIRRRQRLESNDFLSRKTKQLLKNAALYREFYECCDKFDFEVTKVAGHVRGSSLDTIQSFFSCVDRESRKELRIWMHELESGKLDSMTGDCREGNDQDNPAKENWCVYVLKCRNNYLYIGSTNSLERRLHQHEQGTGSKFVRSRLPFDLLKAISCKNASDAKSLEYKLKRLKRSAKIDVLGLNIDPVI